MPRCPLCASAHITVVINRHRRAFCSDCGARWIQDGSQQHTIKRDPRTRTRMDSPSPVPPAPDSPIRPLSPEPPPWPPWPPPLPSPPSPLSPPHWPR